MQQQPPNDQPQYPPQTYPPQPYPPQSYPPQMQPQPRGRRRGCLIGGIIAVVVVVIIVIAAAAANGGKASTTTNSNSSSGGSTPQATATSAPAATIYKVGQSTTLDGWTITVNKVSTDKGSEFNQPQKAGDVFLLVDVSLKNGTGEAQDVSSELQFALKDATGQKYEETFDTDAPSPPDGSLPAGQTLRGTIAYEVPTTQTSFTFAFTPGLLSTDEADYALSV